MLNYLLKYTQIQPYFRMYIFSKLKNKKNLEINRFFQKLGVTIQVSIYPKSMDWLKDTLETRIMMLLLYTRYKDPCRKDL